MNGDTSPLQVVNRRDNRAQTPKPLAPLKVRRILQGRDVAGTLTKPFPMSKRIKVSRTLPPEVLQRIAVYVRDEASFFALLEAMQSTDNALGPPLQAIWDLAKAIRRSYLRPRLTLPRLDSRHWPLVLQAIPLYSSVEIVPQDGLSNLVGHIDPATTNLIIRGPGDLSRSDEWVHALASLPVQELVYAYPGYPYDKPDPVVHLCAVMPRMPHLRRLELMESDFDTLEEVFSLVATSAITDLTLRGRAVDTPHLNQTLFATSLAHLTAWLKATQVTAFNLELFSFDCDEASLGSFYSAIAASSSLETMEWMSCTLVPTVRVTLPRSLKTLALPGCSLPAVVLDSVLKSVAALPFLQHLDLSRNAMTTAEAALLATALVGSNIQDLSLKSCKVGAAGCAALAAVVPKTNLRSLNLGDNAILDEGAIHFAIALDTTPSLHALDLWRNELHFAGLDAILRSVERRADATTEVVLTNNKEVDKRDELRGLATALRLKGVNVKLGWH